MTTAPDRWTAALTQMLAELDEARRALADGDVSRVPTFAVPAGLPPLPPECADLAHQVARELRSLESEIAGELASRSTVARRTTPQGSAAGRSRRFEAIA